MAENKRSNNRRPGFNVGSASIIMVFAVLCLTIFSVLSFTTSSSDLRLSLRASKSISDYYAAELRAQDTILFINQQIKEGKTLDNLKMHLEEVDLESSDFTIRFSEAVDDRRMLLVELTFDKDYNMTVTRWNLLASKDWVPDFGMDIWSGGN